MLYVLSCMNGRRSEWLPIEGASELASARDASWRSPPLAATLLGGTVGK